MNLDHRWRLAAASLSFAAMLGGCFSNQTKSSNGGSAGSSAPAPTPLPGTKVAAVATLLQAGDCNDLLARIKSDVTAKIDAQAALLKKGPDFAPYFGGGYGYAQHGGVVATNAGTAKATDFASSGAAGGTGSAPSSGNAASSAPSGSGAVSLGGGTSSGPTVGTSPSGHSDTNTQVKGVDEADIVKTDEQAKKIYLIHGNTLFTLTSWPPASTAIESQLPIEGTANELFIAGGKAVVFSTIWNQGDIVPLKYDVQSTGIGYVNGGGDYYYQPYYSGAPFTKITTIDVSGAKPAVERELYIEGNYLSSRRHGNTVRAIVQGGFHTPPIFSASIEYKDPWGKAYEQADIDAQVDDWRNRVVSAINKTLIADWVPVDHERNRDGKMVDAAPRCVDFYAPPPALTGYGLTNIVSFDMSNPKSELGGAIVLGNADTVYANAEALVLAQHDWRYDNYFLDREQTTLHLFDLTDTKTTYHASGFVPGTIKDQFSIDVLSGTLRISTTQNIRQNFVEIMPLKSDIKPVPDAAIRHTTDNRVMTLQAKDKNLDRVGISPSLGEDGELIKATRFVGDKGYVTTFRTVDPLSVIDLKDPTNVTVLGAIHIPGFSEYMHPIDAGHLLTIGTNTDVNGRATGLLLQIFDVSNPVQPTRTFKFDYPYNTSSQATSEHKAFTYWVPNGATDGLLAFPLVQYGTGFKSSLEVFRVSTSAGFTPLGSIDHTTFFHDCYDSYGYQTPYYYNYTYCQQPEVRRGLFIQDQNETYVYSISYAGVLVNSLTDLVKALQQVQLPAPDYSEHRYGDVCGDGRLGPTEMCEGSTLNGASCASMGFGSGQLACAAASCTYDTSACSGSAGVFGGTARADAGSGSSGGAPIAKPLPASDAGVAGSGG